MTIQELILLALKISVLAIVFSLGLRASLRDVVYLFHQPWLLARSIFSMNIVMLVFAMIFGTVFPLPLPVKIALVALSLSPVPPILPSKQTKAGGSASYSVSLLVSASLISIVLIPLALVVIGNILGAQYSISIKQLISIVLVSVIAPLCLGLLVRQVSPAFADRIVRPISLFAMVLLMLATIPIAYLSGTVVWQLVGAGVVISLLLFNLIGLAVGHFLGGPVEEHRTVLALATATRHPSIAIAIATINFPEEKMTLAVVLWHLLFSIVLSIPYVRWRRRVHRTTISEAGDGRR